MEAAVVFPELMETDSVPIANQPAMETHLLVKQIAMKDSNWRKERVCELFSKNIQLLDDQKRCFCEPLKKHHVAFSLEEYERGETDLLQLETNTGEAQPRKQRPRGCICRERISIQTITEDAGCRSETTA